MAAFLITGNPGSGKTTVATELSGLGYDAVDADEFAGWETPTGATVRQPEDATDEWLLNHRWVWSRPRVEDVVVGARVAERHVFICGISMNLRDMLDLFNGIFLLSLDHGTQMQRLDTPANRHRGLALRKQILDGRPVFEQEMRSVGAFVLDARQPPSVLVGRILRAASEMTGSGTAG